MKRRTFLKGSAIFLSSLLFKGHTNLIDTLYKLWDYDKAYFKRDLTNVEFLELRKLRYKYIKIKEKERTQEQKDIIYFYERIKFKYLYNFSYNKIKNQINIFDVNHYFFLNRIDSKFGDVKDNIIKKNYIDFGRIKSRWANLLIGILEKKEFKIVDVRLIFAISLIENKFGFSNISSSGALGPLQVRKGAIEHMEIKYNLMPRYKNLNNDEKPWREIITGVYYVRYLIELFDLRINEKHFDLIDLIILMMSYRAGATNIMENIGNEPFDEDVVWYAKAAISILKNNMKVENIQLSKLG